MSKPKAISYIRFSSSQQSGGSTVERQKKVFRDWINSHPEVEESDMKFEDLGLSGYKGHHLNGGFGKLLTAIEDGHIVSGDYIVIEAMDRLGRLIFDEMFDIIRKILRSGVKIVTVQDNQEYNTETNSNGTIYLLLSKINQAYEYSRLLQVRMEKAWEKKRNEAEEGLGVKRKTAWWITFNPVTQRYDTVTDDNRAIMLNIFNWYLNGLGERRILARLKEKYPHKFDTTNPATIKKWLKNKTAIGTWCDIDDVYPAAVDKATFYAVQDELATRRKNSGKTGRTPLSGKFLCGLIKCGCCGSNYSMRKNRHSKDAMLCSNSNKRKDLCDNSKTLPYQILEYAVLKTLKPTLEKIDYTAIHNELKIKKTEAQGLLREAELNIKKFESLMEKQEDSISFEDLNSDPLYKRYQARFKEWTTKHIEYKKDVDAIVIQLASEAHAQDAMGLFIELDTILADYDEYILQGLYKPPKNDKEAMTDYLLCKERALNAFEELQSSIIKSGYHMVAEGSSVRSEDGSYVLEYDKWTRKNDEYLLIENGREITLPVDRPDKPAPKPILE
ncbi:recombinase family protein [Photobacterium damselae subsp. damselae]|uniref:recombinase family protein n=1 Tax=Photobacterium damselae TaxID=38293 RepID=UPI00311B0502